MAKVTTVAKWRMWQGSEKAVLSVEDGLFFESTFGMV